MISRTELTAMMTVEWASVKFTALTATLYDPGSRSSLRNSPRESDTDSRKIDFSGLLIWIAAPVTRAPLESCTVPRKLPVGSCAYEAGSLTIEPKISKTCQQRPRLSMEQ